MKAKALLWGDGTNANEIAATKTFESLCEASIWEACGEAGTSYRDGLGVVVDEERAKGYFETACDQGHISACLDRGGLTFYANGEVYTPEVMKFFQRGCDYDDSVACYHVERSQQQN